MSDMKKLLTIVTESGEKARIDEGVNVSINVSGDSPCDVGEVLAKVTNLSNPRPVTPDMMPAPSAPPPMPMMKAIDIVGKADEPKNPPMHPTMPPMAPETMGQDPMMPDPSEEEDIGTGGIMNPPAGQSGGATGGVEMGGDQAELEALISQAEEELGISENDPEDFDDEDEDPDAGDKHMDRLRGIEDEGVWGTAGGAALGAMAGGPLGAAAGAVAGDKLTGDDNAKESKALTMNSSYKDIHDRLREIDRALAKKNEEFANEPDPSYKDTNYMTKKLAGGLNKPKTMYPDSYKQGDNPMAMETVVREEWQKFKGE